MAHTESEAEPSGRFQPPEVRQRQILAAVARLAVEQGLDNVSMAQVAAEAGIAKGSIYLHYSSRAELISALQANLWDQIVEGPSQAIAAPELSWGERLDLLVEHWVRFEFDHHQLYHAVFHTTGSDSDEPWTRSRELLRGVIEGGVSAGEFEVVDLEVTTEFLLHAYSGPCYHSNDVANTTRVLTELFRRTVGAAAA